MQFESRYNATNVSLNLSLVFFAQNDNCGAVTLVVGDAGNEEGAEASFVDPQPSWSAKTSSLFGYGKLTFQSATAAMWQWMADDGSAIDQVSMSFCHVLFRGVLMGVRVMPFLCHVALGAIRTVALAAAVWVWLYW